MVEYKVLKCSMQGDVGQMVKAHEATLNDYASRGWRVVGCAMVYQIVLIYTLERDVSAVST